MFLGIIASELDALIRWQGSATPTELVFSDFEHGIYRLNGQNRAVTDIWETDFQWGNGYTPSTSIVPGEGLGGADCVLSREAMTLVDPGPYAYPQNGYLMLVRFTLNSALSYQQVSTSPFDAVNFNYSSYARFAKDSLFIQTLDKVKSKTISTAGSLPLGTYTAVIALNSDEIMEYRSNSRTLFAARHRNTVAFYDRIGIIAGGFRNSPPYQVINHVAIYRYDGSIKHVKEYEPYVFQARGGLTVIGTRDGILKAIGTLAAAASVTNAPAQASATLFASGGLGVSATVPPRVGQTIPAGALGYINFKVDPPIYYTRGSLVTREEVIGSDHNAERWAGDTTSFPSIAIVPGQGFIGNYSIFCFLGSFRDDICAGSTIVFRIKSNTTRQPDYDNFLEVGHITDDTGTYPKGYSVNLVTGEYPSDDAWASGLGYTSIGIEDGNTSNGMVPYLDNTWWPMQTNIFACTIMPTYGARSLNGGMAVQTDLYNPPNAGTYSASGWGYYRYSNLSYGTALYPRSSYGFFDFAYVQHYQNIGDLVIEEIIVYPPQAAWKLPELTKAGAAPQGQFIGRGGLQISETTQKITGAVLGASGKLQEGTPSRAHRYWQLLLFAEQQYMQLNTVEMMASADGPNLATGGTASAIGGTLTGSVANLFDGDPATYWQFGDTGGSGNYFNQGLSYAFPQAVEINAIRMTSSGDTTYPGTYRPPAQAIVAWSDDGQAWTYDWMIVDDAWRYTAFGSDPKTATWARPTEGNHSVWGLFNNTNQTTAWNELSFYDETQQNKFPITSFSTYYILPLQQVKYLTDGKIDGNYVDPNMRSVAWATLPGVAPKVGRVDISFAAGAGVAMDDLYTVKGDDGKTWLFDYHWKNSVLWPDFTPTVTVSLLTNYPGQLKATGGLSVSAAVGNGVLQAKGRLQASAALVAGPSAMLAAAGSLAPYAGGNVVNAAVTLGARGQLGVRAGVPMEQILVAVTKTNNAADMAAGSGLVYVAEIEIVGWTYHSTFEKVAPPSLIGISDGNLFDSLGGGVGGGYTPGVWAVEYAFDGNFSSSGATQKGDAAYVTLTGSGAFQDGAAFGATKSHWPAIYEVRITIRDDIADLSRTPRDLLIRGLNTGNGLLQTFFSVSGITWDYPGQTKVFKF